MNGVSSLHTAMTSSHHYTDMNTVRRLSPAEMANPQLRPNNKYLAELMNPPLMKSRPNNPAIVAEMNKEHLTDYPNEAPVVRVHNNAFTGGGLLDSMASAGKFLKSLGA